ncbi:MAG: hypothetical protein JJT78_00095 [Leptospira sp.]|nr:hypothetical protein [Leptospira sp.]
MIKKELIDKHATHIENYSCYIIVLEAILDKYRIPKDASPLVNIRDALSHFVDLYEADSEEKIYGNSYAIDEHLTRGFKDIIVYISNVFSQKLYAFSESLEVLLKSNNDKYRIIIAINGFSNLNLRARLGLRTFSIEESESILEELNRILKSIEDLLKDWKISVNSFTSDYKN